ncbi:DUF1800 domain-containing protein [Jannaschia pohangensis]|uniref:Uncharacterized conserved protein, DUF1800 family n=1 Tax=Jannaschia pohangensis TaxID=390807 RepID=A0A1I3JIV8_9RHOB|nr:DUF1800 domain-containing protein [Jannaschia pohangensis]SFI59855.1 Uncharacterized conserved protein, DUF1800 family [Jannaschia pohangensis]
MRSTIAAIRFGTGLSPDLAAPTDGAEVLALLAGPDQAQAAIPVEGWDIRVLEAVEFIRLRQERRTDPQKEAEYRRVNQSLNARYHVDLGRTIARAAITRDGMRERLMWFWADHFAVEDSRGFLRRTVGGYHEDALRPHLTGRFADLLRAAVTHPAMVAYLDQGSSIGPNSPRGRRGGGLNENLAREVLELHTLGVGARYSQTDVRELAELLTGLSLDKEGQSLFRVNIAEPGAETVLGRSYGGDRPDPGDIDRVLEDLSVHPDTARYLSRKLAVHFVADDPDPGLVAAMDAAWRATDGDLMAVYGAMLDHPAAWSETLQKVRRPLDYVAAVARVTGQGAALADAPVRTLRQWLTTPLLQMGQTWLRPSGPDGWPEDGAAWITPQGLAARLDWAMRVAGTLDPAPDPRAFVDTALGPLASARLRFAADAAEDRAAGIGLILAAPEMQRR